MFGREPVMRMPDINQHKNVDTRADEIARRNDELSKAKSKQYEDEMNARERKILTSEKETKHQENQVQCIIQSHIQLQTKRDQ
jgi:hypothetical protein